jgi:tetratricopeptide (TPR) repeat protein
VRLLQVLGLAAVGLFIYWPVRHGGWLWDDCLDITDNPALRDLAGLARIWFQPAGLFDFYPVKSTVQWLQWQLWQDQTLGYHLTNVGLHLASALLLWRILHKLGLRFAWLGALLFTVHPLTVESVAWIAELKNTLSLPPLLLAVDAFLDYTDRERRPALLRAWLWFLVSLLCKTSGIMLPVFLLVLVWWRRGRVRPIDVAATVPFFATSLLLGIVTLWFQHHRGIAGESIALGGVLARLAQAGVTTVFYLGKSLWPVDLMPVYPLAPVVAPSLVHLWPCLGLGGAVVWLWHHRATWGKHVLLGFGFFVLHLLPVAGLFKMSYFRFSAVADHFVYLPLVGVIGLMVGGMELAVRWRARSYPFVAGAAGLLGLALAVQSYRYVVVFRNEEALWRAAVQRNPNAWVAHTNLGRILAESGRTAQALPHYHQALALNPREASIHVNLGCALASLGRWDDAMFHYHEALRLYPGSFEAHTNLGHALWQTGRVPEAVAHYQTALQLKPDDVKAHNSLGFILRNAGRLDEAIVHYAHAHRLKPDYFEAWFNEGEALLALDRPAPAVPCFEQALRLKSDFTDAHTGLGLALAKVRRLPEALAHLEQAARLAPHKPEVHNNLGTVLREAGNIAAAVAPFEEAVRLHPDFAAALCNLGLTLARLDRYADALSPLERAVQLQPDYPEAHHVLAVALLRLGRTAEAQVHAEKARALNPQLPKISFP